MPLANPSAGALERALTQRIALRTRRRVHRLEIEIDADRIVIRGATASHHVKQLALTAVLEVIGSAAEAAIELDIEVAASRDDALWSPVPLAPFMHAPAAPPPHAAPL